MNQYETYRLSGSTQQRRRRGFGVSRATLYAYVSRGLIRSQPQPGSSRAHAYAREDIERLRRRAEARRDPAQAAAHALEWGIPVLASSITFIDGRTLYYRGHDVVALARSRSVQDVASLIWTGAFGARFAVPTATVAQPPLLARRVVRRTRTDSARGRGGARPGGRGSSRDECRRVRLADAAPPDGRGHRCETPAPSKCTRRSAYRSARVRRGLVRSFPLYSPFTRTRFGACVAFRVFSRSPLFCRCFFFAVAAVSTRRVSTASRRLYRQRLFIALRLVDAWIGMRSGPADACELISAVAARFELIRVASRRGEAVRPRIDHPDAV